ncbi:histidine kinase [Roseivirga sp. E12]|uniref:sensor histidine kinase n=1 Tax=Roseivirga sp. E12 TaxID=2819237 RepID=UPI001ABD15AC|nr:histidine kinase [Roseivirga sp. E12]
MKSLIDKKQQVVLGHLLVWLFSWFIMSLWASKGSRLDEYLIRNLSVVLPTIVLVYINWCWLFPKYFSTKRYWLYSFLALTFLYLIFSLGEIIIVEWMNFLHPDRQQKDLGFDVYALPTSFWRIMNGAAPYTLGLLSSTIFLAVRQKNRDDQEASALRLENAQTKIKYLQSQISPHFLFNSLNNVHSLILQDKEQASDYVIKLSDLLRFMIYETDKDFITLSEEIDLIKKYVALVDFRIGTSIVSDNLNVSIGNSALKIPPLLIFGILENGIKHSGMGTEEVFEFNMIVKENLGSLHVEMNNSISSQKFDSEKKGFGIDSLKKRLDMYYPNAHTFVFTKSMNKAKTTLTLNSQE